MKPDIIAFFLGLAKVFLFCNQVVHPCDKKRQPGIVRNNAYWLILLTSDLQE